MFRSPHRAGALLAAAVCLAPSLAGVAVSAHVGLQHDGAVHRGAEIRAEAGSDARGHGHHGHSHGPDHGSHASSGHPAEHVHSTAGTTEPPVQAASEPREAPGEVPHSHGEAVPDHVHHSALDSRTPALQPAPVVAVEPEQTRRPAVPRSELSIAIRASRRGPPEDLLSAHCVLLL